MLNEKKYLYKKDALTDYFKGKLSAKDLDKIAKDNFGVGIATKKELSSFLSNKFTQDVMSDTYGIPSGTLVKRVRDLMKFAEGIGEDTDVGHQDDEPNMLKSTALEVMEYGKKLMDKLDKYDDMEGEVDFPNWWQSKLTLAKDYLQKAYHYLDSEEKTSETIDRSFRTYDDEGDDEGPKDEGFASDAQRRAAFASGYKAKGKKGKKKKNEAIGKPTISKPFKSNDRTFDKVYNAFDKRDYFNSKGLAKTQIGNFERALKKNDKGAQQILDMFKGDMGKAKDYIIQVISDRNKERAFNNYKAMKDAVDSIQKGKPNVGAVDYVKRIIHNNSQKYSIALYSAISGKKFNNYKDIHKDIDSSINEAYIVLYSPKKGVKPVSTAAYKDKKDAEKWAKDLGGITMIVKKKVKGIDEGKKRYYQQDRVGSAKYTISYHDGKKKHKDGSDFFDIQTFRNKKDLAKFVNTLHKGGYVYGFNESEEDGVPQGYNPVVEDKNQIIQIKKKVGKSETKFYDTLSTIEKKLGKRKYRIWLEKSLKEFGENPKHYDYRTNASIEEKLFQVSK